MSDTTPEAPVETGATDAPTDAKPTETVDFWKTKAREQEKRAKENAEARKELDGIRESQKTEAEKVADRIAKADAEVASLPAKVAEVLKAHLVGLHQIDSEDADLFLTAQDPELLLKQVTRLLGQSDKRKKQGNHAPREGENPAPGTDPSRQAVRGLFGG